MDYTDAKKVQNSAQRAQKILDKKATRLREGQAGYVHPIQDFSGKTKRSGPRSRRARRLSNRYAKIIAITALVLIITSIIILIGTTK